MNARRGFTLLEIIVASLLVATLLVISLKMIAAITAQRQAVVRQQVALAEAANAMERLWSLSWENLTAERAAQIALSPEAAKTLAGGTLQAAVVGQDTDRPVSKLTVRVSWQPASGRTAEQVQLVAWRSPPRQKAEESP